jgi:hypothetical protein
VHLIYLYHVKDTSRGQGENVHEEDKENASQDEDEDEVQEPAMEEYQGSNEGLVRMLD